MSGTAFDTRVLEYWLSGIYRLKIWYQDKKAAVELSAAAIWFETPFYLISSDKTNRKYRIRNHTEINVVSLRSIITNNSKQAGHIRQTLCLIFARTSLVGFGSPAIRHATIGSGNC